MRSEKSKEKSKEKGVSRETTTRLARGVIVKEASETATRPTMPPSQIDPKDKGKGIMKELKKLVKVKGKDQIEYDADVAQRLQAELDKEAMLEREREEEASKAANIIEWDGVQAMMDEDYELVAKLHAEELRAEEQRRKLPTKAQKRNQMSNYLKNMVGYTLQQLRGYSFDEIKILFETTMRKITSILQSNTSSTDSQMHNNIMAAGSKDRPPMLGLGRYSQWRSCFLCVLIQVVPAAKGRPAVQQHTAIETVLNMTLENKEHFQSEKEAIFLLLTGIGDEIYSTVDACNIANEMWIAIERLQQGESLNVQDVKTNLFWEFG
ncbi:hypothetical protein Tco_0257516, partial [Tanacetum coccineum]